MPFDGDVLANPVRVALDVMARVLLPPPPVDLEAWAMQNVVFGKESPFPGPYNPERFPFFARVFHALGMDHPARVVVLCKSAQIGGTVLAQVFCGGYLDLDPGPILYIHPTEGNAKRWVRTKWRPMIRGTTALSNIISATSSKEGGSSTLFQERKDGRGYLQISGANSEASLSMISMPRQVQDDLAKWEMNTAGDPEGQADSRSKAFEWAKILKIGTPLLSDNCRITRAFLRSSQEYFHLPCPHCGHMHPLEWENFHVDADRPEDAHFICPDCGGVIEESDRPAMLSGGQWVAKNPTASTVGFHLWAAYSPLESWRAIAEAWLSARGDPDKEQTFWNDTLGRAYDVQGESPPWEALRDRAEAAGRPRGVIPLGALHLTLGMDCQDDRVEWHLFGWGRDLRRWVIDCGVVEGHIGVPEARDGLNALMKRRWPDTLGNRRPVDLAAIDGNAWTDDVFDWVRTWPQSRVVMVRGVHPDTADPLAIVRKERGRDGKLKRYSQRFFNVGVSPLKLGLYKQLSKTDPLDRGYVDLPAGLGDEYYRQLTAERRVAVVRRGFTVWRWVKPPSQANEMLDTAIYAEAAAIKLGWRLRSDAEWDRLTAEIEVPAMAGQLDLEDLVARPAPLPVAVAAPQPAPAGPDHHARARAARLA